MEGGVLFPRPVSKVLEVIEERVGRTILVVSAPGRADFLNTHQDYKGLPVVPVAVNLRTYAAAVEELDGQFEVLSLSLEREGEPCVDSFSLSPELRGGRWFGDYMRAVVIALRRAGYEIPRGLRVAVDSDVPIGGGMASSAALEVAFAKLLDAYFNLGLTRGELAEIAFKAENEVMGIPCGRLDQYGSSFGGAILLHTKPPYRAEELPIGGLRLVIADSGIRHSVADIHPRRQAEIEAGLEELLRMPDLPPATRSKLGRRYWEPAWEELSLEELEPFLERIDEVAARRIRFTLLMHRYTLWAIQLIRSRSLPPGALEELRVEGGFMEALGRIMDRQHELLRDLYDVSLPELEEIREAMLAAGAYGAKISGAGLGGSLIALADEGEQEKVAAAAIEAGAKRAWIVGVDEGARVERRR